MDIHNAIPALYSQRENFIIIGLTGRTGAGCSTVADFLSKPISELGSEPKALNKNTDNEKRKSNIIQIFSKKNWEPFFTIRASDIITTFMLQCEFQELEEYANKELSATNFSELKNEFKTAYENFKCLKNVLDDKHDKANECSVYRFMKEEIHALTTKINAKYAPYEYKDKPIKFYQSVGDNIRRFGNALPHGKEAGSNIYAISERINKIIKSLRNYDKKNDFKQYFVIDAFRNPIEIKFFQERFSAFYLWAINSPEDDRKDRLIYKRKMDIKEIENVDEKENPQKGILEGESAFVSQNIPACIQAADVLIRNRGGYNNTDFRELKEQILKYTALIKRPGLVTPSRDERCMQVACTAKLNSGCLSRQVGAAVTDSSGYIRSIGWNDAPSGQTPCLLKNCSDLLNHEDDESYSKYEYNTADLKKLIGEYYKKVKKYAEDHGIIISFCFKKFQNKLDGGKNQVYTRSLHAEENAFLALVSGASICISGGTLYTTSSPCFLCAKKAYQLEIARIVYVDPYPDISFDQIFENGVKGKRPKPELYSGALGTAYYKLYQPIISFKDEIDALASEANTTATTTQQDSQSPGNSAETKAAQ